MLFPKTIFFIMSLKQVLCTFSPKSSSHQFLYYETSSEIWWCVPSLFSFCELRGSPTKVFQKYGMGTVFKKAFVDFHPSKRFLAKQTSFISTETALLFLTKWHEKQKTLNSETFALLQNTLTSPQGTPVEKRVTATSASSRSSKKNSSEASKITIPRSSYQQTLITMIRTSLSFSLAAQELLCENKPVALEDIDLFKEYLSQLQEYVEDLPIQIPSHRNDFIDIEVK